jgi:hypothetical protein
VPRRREEDEERSSIPLVATGRTAKEKYLEKSLEEQKIEVRQLSREVARLRTRE